MKRSNKFLVLAAAVVIATVLLFLVYRNREKPTTIRIGYLNITASLPLFIAEEKGFLTEEGAKYETSIAATSNQLVDGIIAGNLDLFIESSAVPVLAVEIQSPGRLKIFSASAITSQAPFDALLVKEGSPIQSLSDLAGKKVGVFPGSTAANLLKRYLADKGVNTSHVSFLPLPPQNQLTALLEGSIDALHAYEPTIAIALQRGGVQKLYGTIYAEMLSPNPQGVAVVSSAFLRDHPQTAQQAIRAVEKAMVFMRQNEAEARQIMARRLKLNDEVARRSIFLYMLPHSEIDKAILQKYSDMLTELGEIKGHVNINGLLYQN